MQYLRSLIYLSIGAVALGLLLLQPSNATVPIHAHCELADGQRISHVYRFDAAATPVAPRQAGSSELAPTPEVYQYYRMPVQSGPTPEPTPAAMGTPTPCVVAFPTGVPTPAATPAAEEVYHLSYSGIPDLEYEMPYTPTAPPEGQSRTWGNYEVSVDGGKWRAAPGFAFAGLKTLLEYWQGFAAAMILVGVLALAWPW